MAKTPQPGFVKTRLRPFLSDDQCAELAGCFLKDAVRKSLSVTSKVIVAFTGDEDESSIFDFLSESTICIRQTGNDLGERIATAIDFAESEGFGPILVIGTDSPTLPVEIFVKSIQRLGHSSIDMVLGGTEDGGYYLVGLNRQQRSIFQGIPWSSASVYSATLCQAKKSGINGVVELPKWYDVDTSDDLRRLFDELVNDPRSRVISPATFRWIHSHRHLFA